MKNSKKVKVAHSMLLLILFGLHCGSERLQLLDKLNAVCGRPRGSIVEIRNTFADYIVYASSTTNTPVRPGVPLAIYERTAKITREHQRHLDQVLVLVLFQDSKVDSVIDQWTLQCPLSVTQNGLGFFTALRGEVIEVSRL